MSAVASVEIPALFFAYPSDLIRPPGSIDDRADDDLRRKARLLVSVHEIPSIRVSEDTEGKLCSLLCGRQIGQGRRWYEIRFAARSFWLDHECFAIWQEEMERAKEHA